MQLTEILSSLKGHRHNIDAAIRALEGTNSANGHDHNDDAQTKMAAPKSTKRAWTLERRRKFMATMRAKRR